MKKLSSKIGLIGIAIALFFTGCQSTAHLPTELMQVKQLHVNDVDLAYVEEGKGETVVFVHGGMGDWRTWDSLRPFISEKYRYVAYSRRYHYPNAWPDDGKKYSVRQHVDDLAAFIRSLNVGPVHLVGNSYAGYLATILAIEHPELLRSVVIGEPGIIVDEDSPEGKRLIAERRNGRTGMREALKAGDFERAAILQYDWVQGEDGAFKKISEAEQQRWLLNARTLGPSIADLSSARYPMTREKIAAIRVPVLVVRGERTNPYYITTCEDFRSCLPPGNSFAVIPSTSHIWLASQTAASKAILDFISKH